jgi:hypothetical protein
MVLRPVITHAQPHRTLSRTKPDTVSSQRENQRQTNEQCSRQAAGTTSQQRSTLPNTGLLSLDETKLAGNAAQKANRTLPQIEKILAEAAAADAAEDAREGATAAGDPADTGPAG